MGYELRSAGPGCAGCDADNGRRGWAFDSGVVCLMKFHNVTFAKVGQSTYMKLPVENTGRRGRFMAEARILEVTKQSYEQTASAHYPLAWVFHGEAGQLIHGEIGEVLLAEYSRVTIQDDLQDVALLGWSPLDKRSAAMFNDITAEWVLEIKVWRDGFSWIDRISRNVRVKPCDVIGKHTPLKTGFSAGSTPARATT